jgi:hypothetical protein
MMLNKKNIMQVKTHENNKIQESEKIIIVLNIFSSTIDCVIEAINL